MNSERNTVENNKVGHGLTKVASGHAAFVALRDSSFDDNQFRTDVVGTGASAALVSDSPCAMNSLRGLSLLQVQDTLTKLHQLTPNYRRLMPQRPKVARSHQMISQQFAPVQALEFTDVVGTGASAALVSDSPCAMNSLRGLSLLQVQDTLTNIAPTRTELPPADAPTTQNQFFGWN